MRSSRERTRCSNLSPNLSPMIPGRALWVVCGACGGARPWRRIVGPRRRRAHRAHRGPLGSLRRHRNTPAHSGTHVRVCDDTLREASRAQTRDESGSTAACVSLVRVALSAGSDVGDGGAQHGPVLRRVRRAPATPGTRSAAWCDAARGLCARAGRARARRRARAHRRRHRRPTRAAGASHAVSRPSQT